MSENKNNSEDDSRTTQSYKSKYPEIEKDTRFREDSPGKFAKLEIELRTRYGQSKPEYPVNYKITELLKARHLETTRALSKPKSIKALDWKERGPGNVGGRTRTIVTDPSDPSNNSWYAGSVGGGMWKTTNSGQTWENLTPELPNLATTTLAVSESSPNIIYAGTGESFEVEDQINGDGIWKSTDKGQTWEQLLSTAYNTDLRNVSRIIVSPQNPDIVLAAVEPGVWGSGDFVSRILRSTDGGINWQEVYTTRNHIIDQIVANPKNFNTIYATVNHTEVIRSFDGGKTWKPSAIQPEGYRMELAVSSVDTSRLYISSSQSYYDMGAKLYTSSNSGETWQSVSITNYENLDFLVQGAYDNTIACDLYDVNRVYVGGIGLWRFDLNGTRNATAAVIFDAYNEYGGKNHGTVHPDQHCITLVPKGPAGSFRMLVSNDGGIFYSDDGGNSFTEANNGYNTTQFYGVDKKNGANEYFGGTQDNGILGSKLGEADPGPLSQWRYILSGDGFDAVWNYGSPNKLLGTLTHNGFYRSIDGGQTWEEVDKTSGLYEADDTTAPFFTRAAKSKQDPDLVFASGKSGVWRTDNFADSWNLTPMPPGWGGEYDWNIMKISLVDPQVVWAGRAMLDNSPLYVSTNGGISFSPASVYPDAVLGILSGFETHPKDKATAYALFSFSGYPKILRTTDLGKTWEDISGFGKGVKSNNGFPDVAVYSLLVMPYNTNIIWAGTEIGIFESVDNGKNWHYADNGFPAACVYEMVIVNDQVVVATHGRGVWSVSLPELKGYNPPPAILSPRFKKLAGGANGIFKASVKLSSAFDSTIIFNGVKKIIKLHSNTSGFDTSLTLIVGPSGVSKTSFSIISYRNNVPYYSSKYQMNVYQIAAAKNQYFNDFNNNTDDFFLNGFDIKTAAGFSNPAIHSIHDYPNQALLECMMKIPIVVAQSGATLSYDEVVIVEPGQEGSVFGSPDFFDYVVVEGSKDLGATWKPLAPGYDSRLDQTWLNAFNNHLAGSASMYRNHTISIQDSFAIGDTIIIRFRLYSDSNTNGWGWAIDNLKIQQSAVGVAENKSNNFSYALQQNYPNPFNPVTNIKFSVAENVNVKLTIYDALGREIKTLVNQVMAPGEHEVQWNAENYPSGIYYCKLEAGGYSFVKKLVILK